MGWSFSYETDRSAYIAEITAPSQWSGVEVVQQRLAGNHLWLLLRRTATGRKFIGLILLAKERGGGWGSKDLSEDMHPYYYDCPLSLLEAADEPESQDAATWRAKVREYHARKRRVFEAGNIVEFGGHTYRLDEKLPGRRGWHVTRLHDGMPFRMPLSYFAQAELVEAGDGPRDGIVRHAELALAA